jgi:23S rRNA G2445 N2-methylase RlmL
MCGSSGGRWLIACQPVSSIDRLRLIGSPDTNKVMMAELSRLSRRALSKVPPNPKKHERAGLIYPFDPDLAMLAVGYQRTATRVLWELYESRASRLEPLYDDLCDQVADDQRIWCWADASVSVRARNVAAFPAGERQVVGTVKNALIDGAHARGIKLRMDPEYPDICVDVRMHDDVVTVSLDLAGTSLSRRGYRESQGAAPLREHLAAVLCMLTRFDARAEIMLDPMCGSGTICIEAALMGTAAPHVRAPMSPVLQELPCFRDSRHFDEPLFADTRPLILGNDVEHQAYRSALANAGRAGVSESCSWRCGDFRRLSRADVEAWANRGQARESTGVIISNPPYGHRLDDREIAQLYRDLSDWCSQFYGWRAAFLVANDSWDEVFGRRARVRKSLKNGPMSCYFHLYDL